MERKEEVFFPPIENECSLFLSIGMPSKTLLSQEKAKIMSQKNQMEVIRTDFSCILAEKFKKIEVDQVVNQEKSHECKWLRKEIVLKYRENFLTRQSIFLKYFNISNQIIGFIDICQKNQITCFCDVPKFRKYANDEISNSVKLDESRAQLQRIQSYYKFINKSPKVAQEAKEKKKIKKLLQNIPDDAFAVDSYSPPSELDMLLETIFKECPEVEPEKLVIVFTKKGFLNEFNTAANAVMKKLNLSSKSHSTLIKCSLIRYVFDSCWQSLSCLLACPESADFQNRCALIGSFSPAAIELSQNPFTDEQYNMPISRLDAVPAIKRIADNLKEIQFLTNPLDIVARILASISKISDVVRENGNLKKMGRFASMVNDVKPKKREMLSFDDCFSLFFVAFITQAPPCAPAIAKFLSSFDVGLSQQMKYAESLLIASVQHAWSFNGKEFSHDFNSGIDEEDDPLGICSSK